MLIAGVDEAGRGPLAGPVVAAAVVLPPRFRNAEITDSKQLSPEMREKLYKLITKRALHWSIVAVGHRRIDKINILQASRLAMSLALRRIPADKVLVDGNVPIETELPQETIVGGDASVLQISAASILAKVWRDRLMAALDKKYPGYGFGHNAGYPTPFHRKAIAVLGPCRIHRRTFGSVRSYAEIFDNPAAKASVVAQHS
ncbi:MAG: ribonuclease HII [Deltaproteobacteria bacterium]|nr:ribonuclease HII [Deltaproteobacteria bacterium]